MTQHELQGLLDELRLAQNDVFWLSELLRRARAIVLLHPVEEALLADIDKALERFK